MFDLELQIIDRDIKDAEANGADSCLCDAIRKLRDIIESLIPEEN